MTWSRGWRLLSATEARELMRRFDDVLPETMIGSWIDTGSRTGAQVARAFVVFGSNLDPTCNDVQPLTDRWEVAYSYDGR